MSSRDDGRQNGWKYYRANEIDELISANIIMCGGRVGGRQRAASEPAEAAARVRSN